MTQWYVNELSKLTKVSVRTLHHYDKIGLLKPSIRLANNYRSYSEKDLLKLQQILALKFFGFELSRIKTLIQEEINIYDHFRAQQKFLEQKVKSLQEASQTLELILSESDSNKSVPWETILKLIEDYNMTKELEHPWLAKVLNSDELREYAHFEQSVKTRFTESQKKKLEQEWSDLIAQVEANLDKDPSSDIGNRIGKQCMDLVNSWWGKKHAALRTAIWQKGYQEGKMEVDPPLSPQVVDWLDKAIADYYRNRAYNILSQVETQPSDRVLMQWEELLEDMHGHDQALNDAFYEIALKDDHVSTAAKNWLKKISK
ncbi:MAG: MerR family transcriptional regulator [Alphaproteobacteria bacterium 41-28]|nr:MAG: MerR family transcriptional regulator [Alphaproteobacteria bacterium 41-28]